MLNVLILHAFWCLWKTRNDRLFNKSNSYCLAKIIMNAMVELCTMIETTHFEGKLYDEFIIGLLRIGGL